jgi:type III restriction enzyme
MILKEYQEKAVGKLYMSSIQLLAEPGVKSIVFKAPTGSGKTVMMQSYLKRLAETPKLKEVVFLWISVNDLSRQSKRSFERNLSGSKLYFSELSDVSDRELRANEILFINWESIRSIDRETGNWKVLAMKENERDENLPTYLENTHKAGRDIVLIIDESHRSLNTVKAQELIQEYIKPKLQIEVSATPDSENYDQKVEVHMEEVIEAGMTKQEILINPGI